MNKIAISFGTTRKLVETAHNLTDVMRGPQSRFIVKGVDGVKRDTIHLSKGTTGHEIAHELGHFMDPYMREAVKMEPTAPLIMRTETTANRNALKLMKQIGAPVADRAEYTEKMKFPFSTYRGLYAQHLRPEELQTKIPKKFVEFANSDRGLRVLEQAGFMNATMMKTMREAPRLVNRFESHGNIQQYAYSVTKKDAPTPFVFKGKE